MDMFNATEIYEGIEYSWRKYFTGGVFNETFEAASEGGPTCYNTVRPEFRYNICLLMIPLEVYILQKLYPKLKALFKESKESAPVYPNFLEYLAGIVSIAVYLSIFVCKLSTGKAIFMFNPCHMILLVHSYFLLTKRTTKREIRFGLVLSLLFGPAAALVFPGTTGLDLPFEVELYYIEHYLGAFINPLILSLSGRYHKRAYFNLYYRIFGFEAFSLYNRAVLTQLAINFWVNLNENLCHSAGDPFYGYFGKWYYLFAEVYMQVIAFVYTNLYLLLIEAILFVKRLVFGKGKVKNE